MNEFRFRYDELIKLVEICKDIDLINKWWSNATTVRTSNAEKLFRKGLLSGISFIKLIPKDDDDYKFIDTSSLASIARNIIENYRVFVYDCEKGISKEESTFRSYLQSLHHSVEAENIYKKFGLTIHYDDFGGFLLNIKKHAKKEIKENAQFKKLKDKLQKQTLEGDKAYYLSRCKSYHPPFGIEKDAGIYKLLSNSVHTQPFAFSMNKYSFNHIFDGGYLVFISVEVCIAYLACLVESYLQIRKTVSSQLELEDKRFIKQLVKDQYFIKWLEAVEQKGKNSFL